MTTQATEPQFRLEQKRKILGDFPGPKSVELAARRAKVVAGGVASSVPVYVADADGGIVQDVDGNSFIDLGSGIAVTSVGASDPAVVGAVKEQVEHFTHTCFMVSPYEGYIAVAEQLNELTPGDHDKRTVLFNSGAEAVENAVKVARVATGRTAVVAFDHAYHGRTNLTMGLTAKANPYKSSPAGSFGPFAPEIYRVPMSYPFREEAEIKGEDAARRAITMIEKQIGAENVAAILIEPIQGEGGFIVPAEGFLPALAAWAKDKGVVFIADEVQAGFCRTGEWFASDHEGIVPDIITMAKGIAGGMPLSAITGRAELMDAVHAGGLGGTYGGNPVACAAALAAIETMKEQDLNARARSIESQVRARLEKLAAEVDIIGEVRGRGAMLALEFVQSGTAATTKAPNAEATKAISAACLKEGVIILTCGTYGLLADALDVLEGAIRAAAA
jgi:4-aminobutyrate aminotransferase/(S)-3-amino-2-methylpropionate transaminase